eukprot:1133167-Alexandrium_andersonii.AAC.1
MPSSSAFGVTKHVSSRIAAQQLTSDLLTSRDMLAVRIRRRVVGLMLFCGITSWPDLGQHS